MKKELVISQAGALTCLGGLDETWSALLAGECGLIRGVLGGELSAFPVGMVDQAGGRSGVPGSRSRLDLLLDRLLAGLSGLPEDIGLIVSSTKGAVDELAVMDTPVDELSGQPWQLAGMIAARLGISTVYPTVSAACASGTIALIEAGQILAHEAGAPPALLVIGLDLLSHFVLSGFAQLKALSPDACRPFDRGRRGLSLGEGAGWLLITSREEAERRDWPVLAVVRGWGVSGDAGHITAPCRRASGLIRALGLATGGGRRPVGAVNAHGTGTVYNDAMEMTAFASMGWDDIPVHSVKGGLGHCLGAAGVIEAALAVRSLAASCIPPTVGFVSRDDPGPTISGSSNQALAAPTVLSCNSGFGGINAAILFGQNNELGDGL